jgi:hypothetical protein
MSSLTRFVSRKVLAAVVAFAVFAIALVGVSIVRQGTSTLDLSSTQGADALGAALADPTDQTSADQADAGGASQLQADLRAARALKGSERAAALKDIRAKALAGDYGSRVERRAERRDIRHDLFFSLLPDNLQADINAMKAAPADQRKQMRADILDKAVAGDYGSEVQKAAERLQALHKS